mmetsp:Transcript_58504/g.140395  ORF Transcript_58504/g.140395 Transcript_58504/m.140395 type:complete len:240 (+) Transcript_58504:270-989(+)
MHARRADLHLHQPAARQEHRVVQRLVAVLLGRRDIVLVVAARGAPEAVHGPHRGVAALLVVTGDQQPHRQDVPRLLAPPCLGEGAQEPLGSVLHTHDAAKVAREGDVLLQLERRVLQSRRQLSRRAIAALPPVVKRAEGAGRGEGEDGTVARVIDAPLERRGEQAHAQRALTPAPPPSRATNLLRSPVRPEQREQCRCRLFDLGRRPLDLGAVRDRGGLPRAGMRPREWFALARMGART